MSLAADHKNLAVLPDGTVAVNPREPRQVRARLLELLAQLGADVGRRGGTIYIPRVGDGQLWIDVTEPLRIPREITLSLAPGVVLVPVFLRSAGRGDESHLEIEGVFTAPLATIFATPGWFQRNSPADASRYDVGAVRLTSPHLERVHPEWWGAAALDDLARPDDSEALAAAVRAGLHDRVNRRVSNRPPLRALAIELRGTYALGEPLRLTQETTGIERGLELRGVPGADEQPTFRCAELAFIRTAMVEVEGIEAVTFVDLRFDGGERAATCLSIRGAHTDPTARAHVLRRCGFRDAYGPLVSYRPSDSSSKVGQALPGAKSEGLQIEHCRFERKPMSVDPQAALDVTAPPTSSVELRGCTFRGVASAMIHARSCALAVTSCHFHNEDLPATLPHDASADLLHRRGPVGGVDLYLDGPEDGFAATLYAQDCRSTSAQFLVTCMDGQKTMGDVTVVGLHYTRGPGVVLRRAIPSIEYRPRWFEGTEQLDPITLLDAGDSKFEIPSKIRAKELPVRGASDPFGVPTKVPPMKPSEGIVHIDKGADEKGMVGVFALEIGGIPFAPILWRLSGEGAGRLILVGCRFDFPTADLSASVRGIPVSTEIIDLGVLHGDGHDHPVEVNDPARLVEVPIWPHRP